MAHGFCSLSVLTFGAWNRRRPPGPGGLARGRSRGSHSGSLEATASWTPAVAFGALNEASRRPESPESRACLRLGRPCAIEREAQRMSDDEKEPVLAPLCHISADTAAKVVTGHDPGPMTEERLKAVRDEAMAAATGGWTTKVPPTVIAHYGWLGELHAVMFSHRSDPGTGERETVTIQVPEDSEEYARKTPTRFPRRFRGIRGGRSIPSSLGSLLEPHRPGRAPRLAAAAVRGWLGVGYGGGAQYRRSGIRYRSRAALHRFQWNSRVL